MANLTTANTGRRTTAKAPLQDRWYAVVANGGENTFVARAEYVHKGQLLDKEECAHKHSTAVEAKACALKLADKHRLTL